jgi:hypothetical protein
LGKISVLKTEPDRPVEPVEPGTGGSPVWSECWTVYVIEPVKTGKNRQNRRTGGFEKPAV